MFGRSKQDEAPVVEKVGGKGRPTPSRKDAQAAAKERARTGLDPKSASKADRARRSELNARAREGMKNGEEKYLMARDQGPVRRFIRDFIDTRLSFMEFLLPVLVLIMLLQGIAPRVGQTIWAATILLLLIDVFWLNFSLGRELNRRFPDESKRGWRVYAFMRAIQIRPLRLPKPQRKLREKLPDRY